MAIVQSYFRVCKADISGLLLIVPEHASIAANVNDNCVFRLFAARFGCHHPRERIREGRHALVCLGWGGACCGGDSRR